MLDQLSKRLNQSSPVDGSDINIVANTWLPRMAKHIFRSFENQERILGCSIILAWVHPTRDRPALALPWSYVHILRSPEFIPTIAAEVGALSIGCGSGVPQYVKTVKEICQSDEFLHWSFERQKMDATFLSAVLRDRLENNPSPGISKFFQMALVTRGPWSIAGNERLIVSPDGTETREQFPAIARSYREFLKMCESRRLTSRAAST